VFRQASEAFPGSDFSAQELEKADLSILSDEAEMDLIHRIAQYPRMIEAAAEAHEPHRVAFYLYDVASALHSLWNKVKDLPQLRFVNQTDKESTKARLALVHALRGVLASGLAILGVTAPNEMR
jgi:arginyl-tRNA synthetase